MRRNISSELIVALLAAVSLVFAAVFAVLLSTSTSPRPPSQPTVTTVDGPTSTLTADSVSLTDATGTAITEEVTSVAIATETPMPQPLAATEPAPTVVATTGLSLSRTPVIAVATQLPLVTQTFATQSEIAFLPGTTTPATIASATPPPTDVPPTATLHEMMTGIAPANLTLTAIRETVVALAKRSTARAQVTAEVTPVDATGTPLATEPASDTPETVMPSPTDVLPTATLEEAVTRIAPANLTLTAIRETVVALAARSTARAEERTVTTTVDATEAPLTTEIALAEATAMVEPSPTDVLPTATLDEAVTRIAPANLTLTAIRETVAALAERSTARAEEKAELTPVVATGTPLATETAPADATETPKPSPTVVLPTATLQQAATRISPANLTLTAIRETVAALAERSTARADKRTVTTPVDATGTPLATEPTSDATQTSKPSPTVVLPTATLEEAVTRIAPANLTLTAIRETVVALEARSTARAEEKAELTAVEATETPIATEPASDATETVMPSPTDVLPTATLDEAATRIAPANLTLTAIRETVAALAARSTARAKATAELSIADATETPIARETAPADATETVTAQLTDVRPTATLDEAATRIAPANLTLAAIRETVVALAARSTARAEEKAELTAVGETETPLATEPASDAAETPMPSPTDVLPTATLDEAATGMAPANLTLTAIRETVGALAARSTARAEATAELTVVDAMETPLATEIASADATETPVPPPTDVLPTATLDEAATRIAPANLTLTAIRDTVVALAKRSTARAQVTAEVTPVDVTETPLVRETVTADTTQSPMPSPTAVLPSATLEEAATRIAPANLTLTAIRETVVTLAARSTAQAEATAELTVADAMQTPLATETASDATETVKPSPTDVPPTATLEATATGITPANLTLTAIRETVVALAARSTARAEERTVTTPVDATETPLATATAQADATETVMPSPTDVLPTATLDEAVTRIAPANLTLTAIRETVVALEARSTARAEEKAVSTPVDATGTPLVRKTVTADTTESPVPSPTVVLPTATLEEAVTRIAPANLTLTAIRETVVALAKRSTARAQVTAEVTPVDVTETPLARETAPADAPETVMPSPTDVLPTATLDEAATRIAPANLTLTAIRETVVALAALSTARAEERAVSTPVDATRTPLATEPASDATETVMPSPTDVLPTATLDEAATGMAPANLTLTAIRETVVALAKRSTARAQVTAEVTPVDVTEKSLVRETVTADTTESPMPSPTVVLPTATLEATATGIAPANLTLTAIRETVVALAARSTARAAEKAELTAVGETETPLATEPASDATETVMPSPTDVLPTATLDEAATGMAPANLTLTAIRDTVVALAKRSTARAQVTAEVTPVDVTETPLARETAPVDTTETVKPLLTDVLPSATLDEAVTRIAPANLTLTAIRETVVALAARSTARAEEKVELTAVDATEMPLATETVTADATQTPKPSPTDVLPSATLDEAATRIAPANLTLTAIRETVVALAKRSTARAEERTVTTPVDATDTPLATKIAPADATETATAQLTEVLPSATLEATATGIAPANLTLTAIRKTVVALAERSTAQGEATAETTAVDATDTPVATEPASDATQSPMPSPTVVPPAATLDEAATRISPANLTLTVIRETVAALAERSTARAEERAVSTPVDATETRLAMAAPSPVSTEFTKPLLTDAEIADTATPDAEISAPLTASATPKPSDTASPTVVRTATATPLPFHFARLIPTPTDVGSSANQVISACEVPPGWQPYEVQAGDTLLTLALATSSSLVDLRDGNCFEPIRGIFAGQRLFVPRLPVDEIEKPAPVYPQVDKAADLTGCDQPNARISAPEPMASLKGVFALRGTVQLPEGSSYQIALRPAWADNYYLYLSSNKRIRGDVIALINTEIFGAGLHRIRLTVTSRDGKIVEGGLCDIPVIFVAP